tara:strand:+ start:266 stop:1474 length:1209 start_codon:yes stop_codon:yes gene_type:complete
MFLDIEKIRNDFIIFKNNPNLIYLDNASTTHKPKQVIDKIVEYYENYNSNIHRGIYKIAEKATLEYENVREKVKNYIGSDDLRSIVFTRGTTESINLVAHSFGQQLNFEDEILITEMEHHSNIVPWQLLCKRVGAKLSYIPVKTSGELELSNIEKLITNKTRLVSITHQSNVFGTINPIKEIVKIAHKKGALVLVDGAQMVPHHKINVQDLGCDYYVFSGHKMLGPTGVGILYARPEILNSMNPFMGGGEMISSVTMQDSKWNEIPWKFEAGTSNIAQVIGLGSAIEYIENIGFEKIYNYEIELLKYTEKKLNTIDDLTIYGTPQYKGGVVSFNINNIHPHDIAQMMDNLGIAIRAGHHCAQPIMNKLNVTATNRLSLYIYNTKNEIDIFIEGLKNIINLFK